MLKITCKLFSGIVLMAGISTSVMAQSTVTGTTAGVVIITPVTISEGAALHFGTMSVKAATGGTCVLSSIGERTSTAGVNLSGQSPVATNAAYHVGGQSGTTYTLTLPATITVTEITGLTAIMTIGDLVARFNGTSADAVTSTLSAGGNDSFTVGGTLTVAAAQTAGEYAGTFNVTVAYN